MTTDRDVESEPTLQDFVAELRRLADALEAGSDYEIEIDGETVRVPGHAVFSIEHEREEGSNEIEFQISWSNDEDEDEDDGEDDQAEDADARSEEEV